MSCSSFCGLIGGILIVYQLYKWIEEREKNYHHSITNSAIGKLRQNESSVLDNDMITISKNDKELQDMMDFYSENRDRHWDNLLNEEGNLLYLMNQFQLDESMNQWGHSQPNSAQLNRKIALSQRGIQQRQYSEHTYIPATHWNRYGDRKGINNDHPIYKATCMFPRNSLVIGMDIKSIPHLNSLIGIRIMNRDGYAMHYNLANLPTTSKEFYLDVPESDKSGDCSVMNTKCMTGNVTFIYAEEPKFMPLVLLSIYK